MGPSKGANPGTRLTLAPPFQCPESPIWVIKRKSQRVWYMEQEVERGRMRASSRTG